MSNPLNHDNSNNRMNIFYLILLPLFYWGIQHLFLNENVRLTDILKPFFLGLALAVPMQLLYWAFDIYFSLNWTASGIYFYTFFNQEGFIYLPFIAILICYFRKNTDGNLYIREILGFFSGYYFLFSFVDILTGSALTSYDLIYLPIIRMALMLTATVLFNRFLGYQGKTKIIMLTVIIVLPFIFNIFPLFFILNRILVFHLIFIPVFISALIFFYLEIQNKLPG